MIKFLGYLYQPIKNISLWLFILERDTTIAGHLIYFKSEKWRLFGEWLESGAKKSWEEFENNYLKEQLYRINKALYEYKILPQTHLEGEELEKYLREL